MIESDTAHVEYGGGFYHFGYRLWRYPQSDTGAGSNTWVLSLYREGGGSTELTRVTLGRDDALTEQQFVDRAFAEFERRIARSVAGAGGLIIVGEESDPSVLRCQFALKHGQIDRLKESIRNTARQHPDAWREVLLVHALDAPLDPRGANERLRQWAASKGDFTAWILAAYAFDALGDASAAEEAVRTACTYPAISPAWMNGSARYCGYPMCRRLCAAGEFETGVALCDRLLQQQPDDTYLKVEIGKIRAACAAPRAAEASAPLPVVRSDELFDPFGGIELAALRPVAPTGIARE